MVFIIKLHILSTDFDRCKRSPADATADAAAAAVAAVAPTASPPPDAASIIASSHGAWVGAGKKNNRNKCLFLLDMIC